ncbi:MAG: class I SAM-dependent methyltransferase [Thermodesulforhabdaceae bacterium]
MLLKSIINPEATKSFVQDFILGSMKLRLNPVILTKYLFELKLNEEFYKQINESIEKARKDFPDPRLGGWMFEYHGHILYTLVRLLKPEVVIETGVGPGGTSALVLLALNANKKGRLLSIDLPGADLEIYLKIGKAYHIHIPPGYQVGWLVPSYLRNRWHLQFGDSKELLPELLNKIGAIDMFLHDSLHTDEHVMFELSTVFPYVKKGGLILADDVNEYWTLAFTKFCKEKGIKYTVFGNRLGVARK